MRHNTPYIRYFAWLRAVACVAIVVLHAFFMARGYFPGDIRCQAICQMVRNLCLWAVPCFVMVTGALLLDPGKPLTAGRIFRRYVLRVVTVLLVCSAGFYVFDRAADGTLTTKHAAAHLIGWLRIVWTGGSWLHMWYLYLLIGLYLLLPVYRVVAAHATGGTLRYYLVLLLVFQSVIPAVTQMTGETISFYVCVFTIYPLYLFLGHALHTGKVTIRPLPAVLLVAASSALLLAATWFGQTRDIAQLNYFGSSYSSPLVIAQSLGVFALAKGLENAPLPAIIRWLDRCSFGIFLLHVVVLKVIYRVLAWDPFRHGGYAAVAGTALAALLSAWFVTGIFVGIKTLLPHSRKTTPLTPA